jgi:hypothetical protein
VNSRRLKAIHTADATAESPTGSIPAQLERQITDPVLWTSVQMNAFTGLGVVFLMTTKPDLIGSLITLIVTLVLGIGFAQLWPRPRKAPVLRKEAKLSER